MNCLKPLKYTIGDSVRVVTCKSCPGCKIDRELIEIADLKEKIRLNRNRIVRYRQEIQNQETEERRKNVQVS